MRVGHKHVLFPCLMHVIGFRVDKMIKQFRPNVFGVLDVTNAALPYMRESKFPEMCM
jgi:hypothetical protein